MGHAPAHFLPQSGHPTRPPLLSLSARPAPRVSTSSPSPSSSPARNGPRSPATSHPLGPHAKAAPPPYKRDLLSPRTLTLLLRRPEDLPHRCPFLSPLRSPRPHRGQAAPPRPRPLEAFRAVQWSSRPRHHRNRATPSPPVSCAAPAILRRRRSPDFPNPSGIFTGPSRIDLR
jgi:hypothetical protein